MDDQGASRTQWRMSIPVNFGGHEGLAGMKRSIVAGALLAVLAVLAIWALLGGRASQKTGANRPIQTRAQTQEPAPGAGARPTDRAATPEVPEVPFSSTQASTEEEGSASCTEAARLGLAFARSAVLDEETCAQMLRIVGGSRVPVLPGFAGFEIPDFGDRNPLFSTTQTDSVVMLISRFGRRIHAGSLVNVCRSDGDVRTRQDPSCESYSPSCPRIAPRGCSGL